MAHQQTCPVCGAAFTTTHANHQFCTYKCSREGMKRRTKERIEREFGDSLADLLHRMYIEQGMSVRQIIAFIRCGNHTLLRWLDECGIEKRRGSVAIAQQWVNNDARRQATSEAMSIKRRNGTIDVSGEKNAMRRPELRKQLSDMRKGAGNPMYNRLGADNPMWKGGKVTEYGPGWRSIRVMVRRRDGDKCIRCGSAENLQVHHIIPYRESHDNSPENLVTLCGNCHPRVERGSAALQLRLLNGIEGGTTKANRSASARHVGGRKGRQPAK